SVGGDEINPWIDRGGQKQRATDRSRRYPFMTVSHRAVGRRYGTGMSPGRAGPVSPAVQLVHEAVEGQFELGRGLVDTGGDLAPNLFDLFVSDLGQPADPIE